jgi:YggT family protein
MFVLANFVSGLARVLDVGLNIYLWLIIIRAVLSWVNPDPYNPIVRFLGRSTDPVLHWVRRKLPIAVGGIDFSPIIVILAIYFLQAFLVRSLLDLATMLR